MENIHRTTPRIRRLVGALIAVASTLIAAPAAQSESPRSVSALATQVTGQRVAATSLDGPPGGCFARLSPSNGLVDATGQLKPVGGVIPWTQKEGTRLSWTSPGGAAAVVMRVVYKASQPATRRIFMGGAGLIASFPATNGGWSEWTFYVSVGATEWMQADASTSGDLTIGAIDYCVHPYTPGATVVTTPPRPAIPAPAAPSQVRLMKRTWTNQLPDLNISSDFCGSNGWTLGSGAAIDPSVTRGSCGSLVLPNATTCTLASADLVAEQDAAQLNGGRCPAGTGSNVRSIDIPVDPPITWAEYSFAGYMRSEAEPRGTVTVTITGNIKGSSKTYAFGSVEFGNSKIKTWEEFAVQARVPSGITSLTLSIGRFLPSSSVANPPQPVSKLWFDDLSFGPGDGYASPPTAKTPFSGSDMAVDALGNFTRRSASGKVTNFFPMCIAPSTARHGGPNGFRFYSSHGWNCVWSVDPRAWKQPAELAESATDPEFAPEGMCFQLDVNPPIVGWGPWSASNASVVQSAIRTINLQGHEDSLCGYILDAEDHSDKLPRVQATLSMIDATDRENNNGVRRHPIIANVPSPGLTRWYRRADGTPLIDVSGTYVYVYGGLQTQDNIEGQTAPGLICQTQSNLQQSFRGYVYRCLAQGSKGISFWADDGGAGSVPVEQESWWADSPILAREINAMLPLLRQPHWTNWSVDYGSDTAIYVGTRDLNGQGYIIASNDSDRTVTVKMNVAGLGYTPQSLVNYFTGKTVATFSGTTVTFTLPPSGNAGSVGGGGGSLVAQLHAANSPMPNPATRATTQAATGTKTATTKKGATTKKAGSTSATTKKTATTKKG